MQIKTESGKTLDTKTLPSYIEPTFCASCGERLAWMHTGFTEEPLQYCDDCAADLKEE